MVSQFGQVSLLDGLKRSPSDGVREVYEFKEWARECVSTGGHVPVAVGAYNHTAGYYDTVDKKSARADKMKAEDKDRRERRFRLWYARFYRDRRRQK